MVKKEETIVAKTLSGGKSYALISVLNQALSWIFTFWVIRLLNPEDYGLMAMAAFITSFLHVFSGLGLGAGIVQMEDVTDNDLSSIFWFSIFVGLVMSIVIIFLAYPNAYIFENFELVPITQLVSALFIISAIATVPLNILSRNYQFKDIAVVNVWAAMISSITSVFMAYCGFGVYTLILSSILLQLIQSLGYLYKSSWLPKRHFDYQEVKPFLKFGITLSFAAAVARLIDALDKLIIGKLYNAVLLGYYSTANSLSNMPIDKISPLINPIVFPIFSRWQNDSQKSEAVYLKILKYYLLVITPIYMGGGLIAKNMILLVLGEKWIGIVYIFQVFCGVKLFKVLSSYHKVLLASRGLAIQILKFDIFMGVVLVSAIYIGATISFEYAVYAWGIVYPIITICWVLISLNKCGIKGSIYIKTIGEGMISSCVMLVTLLVCQNTLFPIDYMIIPLYLKLTYQIIFSVFVFSLFIFIFQRQLIFDAVMTLFFKKR